MAARTTVALVGLVISSLSLSLSCGLNVPDPDADKSLNGNGPEGPGGGVVGKVVVKDGAVIKAYFMGNAEDYTPGGESNGWFLFPSTNLFGLILYRTGDFAVEDIGFSGAGCTGTAYYTNASKGFVGLNRIVRGYGGTYYKITALLNSVSLASSRSRSDGTCTDSPWSPAAGLLTVIAAPQNLSSVAPIILSVD